MKNEHQNNKSTCRFCGEETFVVIDLGYLPLANVLSRDVDVSVNTFPTVLHVCSNCATAQLNYCADLDILYRDYVYITPESSMLSEHYGKIIEYLQQENYFEPSANVLEIGSNIGRFLKHIEPYVQSVLGVDPAKNIASMAREAGIQTISEFFNIKTAKDIVVKYGKKDLIVARHCFAHNEKPWLMLEGVAELLAPEGVFVIENAYFPDTVERGEFDQIYHEHMYYYNLRSIQQVVQKYGFKLVDCLHSQIHGGTMLYIVKRTGAKRAKGAKGVKGALSTTVLQYLKREKDMHKQAYYTSFIKNIQQNKIQIREMIRQIKAQGKTVYAYGASAKSTTLLNYFGIDSTMIPFVVDSTITKQGKYIPLTQIKIISEEEAHFHSPDYYLLTIWNYKDEIIRKVRASGNYKSSFIIPHPSVEVIE